MSLRPCAPVTAASPVACVGVVTQWCVALSVSLSSSCPHSQALVEEEERGLVPGCSAAYTVLDLVQYPETPGYQGTGYSS